MTLRFGPGLYSAWRDADEKVGPLVPPGGTYAGSAFSCWSARCGVVAMMDAKWITRGQLYRYFLRQVVVGDHLRLARASLGEAQAKAGVPPGRWMGRGLGDLGLRAGAIVTEDELRQLFGEGRHPHGDRLVAEALAAGKTPAVAARAGKLGRAVEVTGADLVFRAQPTIQLLWALGEEETRRVIEAAHERAIEATLTWIEDHAATIRVGAQGRYPTRPVHSLAFARFRHYESRAGTPLLHDHVLVSLRGLRPDGKWGAVHSTTLLENVVAASSLYNELVMAEVCEELGVASEPRTVSAGRRPVMEVAGVPHELIGWMSKRGQEIDLCRSELEYEYVTAVDEDGNLKFAPVVSEEARTKLNRIAARKTRSPKPQARSLAQLRADWRASVKEFLGEAADLVDMLLERARAAAAPAELGEWDIPRVPLRYDRAVIASTALTHQLRTVRGAGRARYYEGVVVHQQAAMPEQLLLFPDPDVEEPEAGGEPTDYMERLRVPQKARARTGAQDLTAEQISSIQARIEEMKRRGEALRERYEPRPEAPVSRPVLEDQERGQRPGQPGAGHGGVSR
ncbi:MobF family relaxase [Streptomyces sp. NPDC090135]|uniref:MobF family relaxase n=1 Tax=Streptomyces sp. NPDC090135 TaxID=3365957 RepID=UPI003802917F